MGLVVVVMTRYHFPLLQKGNGKGVEEREGSEGEGNGSMGGCGGMGEDEGGRIGRRIGIFSIGIDGR